MLNGMGSPVGKWPHDIVRALNPLNHTRWMLDFVLCEFYLDKLFKEKSPEKGGEGSNCTESGNPRNLTIQINSTDRVGRGEGLGRGENPGVLSNDQSLGCGRVGSASLIAYLRPSWAAVHRAGTSAQVKSQEKCRPRLWEHCLPLQGQSLESFHRGM